jgi:cofilin
MLYASSKEAIRKRLVGVGVEIQGTDETEISYETILEKVTRSH